MKIQDYIGEIIEKTLFFNGIFFIIKITNCAHRRYAFVKRVFAVLLLCVMLLSALPLTVPASAEETTMENISIGGGGSFFTPMIDPTNTDRFYATCDMGDLYYSEDRGQTWNRTESRCWLRRACIAEDGTVFAGSCGLYASTDHGRTLELIYPKNPHYRVSRCGWREDLMLADGYDNGYLSGVTTSADKVWFATTSWEGYFRLMYADYDGSNLHIVYQETLEGVDYDSVEVKMATRGNQLYYTFKNQLWKYDPVTDTITQLYCGQGNLMDVEWIQDRFFLLDDTETATKILYTKDFETWSDLQDYNDLPTTFEKWGQTYTFDWHFKEIVGNNFDNIYLSFACDVSDGIMKFNGRSFEWVFDSMYKTRDTITDDGWSYGCHGPFYGICADPSDDDFCLTANTETVYTLHYGGEDDREVHTTHCTQTASGAYRSNGLDVQTTYSVKEDPFNSDHIIICTTDLGIQNSYDNGQSFQRMEITGGNWDIFNTCYDLYFDTKTEGLIYGLWSNRHDAPYAPYTSDVGWTQGAFAVSRDGGTTWDFSYSSGLPADCIPVKMSVEDNGSALTIAVATFNRGFFISYDSGKTFTALNSGMDTVEGLIWGEDIVLTQDHIYCLSAPYNCITGYWEPAVLYDYNRASGSVSKIDLGELVLVRSLTYHEDKGLYLNVIPTYHYEWFPELDNGFWVNDNGGIYHYDGNSLSCVFACNNGIFHSGFAPDGTMYATEPYGKVYAGKDGEFAIFADGLYNQLKNVSFSSDGGTLYVTTFGGGTYRTSIAPHTHDNTQNRGAVAATCTAEGYTGDTYCRDCGEKISAGTVIPAAGHSWDQGVVTEEATEEKDGIMTYTCSVCSETKTESIVYEKKRKEPSVSLRVTTNSAGKLVFRGAVDDYDNLGDYYEITGHGIVYVQSSRIGSRTLTLNTSGRTRVNFSAYNDEGAFTYTIKPSSKTTAYTIRAFLICTDPETGKSITVYSDMIRASVKSLQ